MLRLSTIYFLSLNFIVFCDWVEVPQIKYERTTQSSIITRSDLLKRYSGINNFMESPQLTPVSIIHPTSSTKQSNSNILVKKILLNDTKTTTMTTINRKGTTPKVELPRKTEVIEENIEEDDDGDVEDDYDDDDEDDDDVTVENETMENVSGQEEIDEKDEDEKESITSKQQPQKYGSRTASNLKSRTRKIYRLVPMPTPAQSTTEGIFDFFKNMQENIFSKTFSGIQDKVNFLQNFRDELLLNINNRIKLLWPTQVIKRRVKRGSEHSEHSTHMDFPSAEGALITICFLTFAVFLIKLVLQVINTIKSKHYSINGFEQSAMGAVKIMRANRNARKLSNSGEDIRNFANVLEAIEKHKRKN